MLVPACTALVACAFCVCAHVSSVLVMRFCACRDSSIGFVANSPYLASTALAQMKHNYRNTLKNDYEQLRLEYDAML